MFELLRFTYIKLFTNSLTCVQPADYAKLGYFYMPLVHLSQFISSMSKNSNAGWLSHDVPFIVFGT